jgi:hypothetical protein
MTEAQGDQIITLLTAQAPVLDGILLALRYSFVALCILIFFAVVSALGRK